MPRPGAGLPAPRLTVRDTAAEAIAGIVQRPGRAGLTMLGTVLGVGAFVAVLGLTATSAGQISRQFSVLEDTTVTVADNGPANDVAPPGTYPSIGFPADADAVADHIKGVVAAGVWWPVALPQGTNFSASQALSGETSQTVNLVAVSPGAVKAMVLTMAAGSPLSNYENDTAQHVAMLNTTTAATLGISAARLPSHPAVFVNGIAYTVVGIYSSAQRVVSGDSGMLIPENTALEDYGNPQPGIGSQEEAQMVVATRTGAAEEVSREIAAAELPTDPHRLVVTPPQNPLKLQGEVNGDLAGLFLILALISLLIGAVGIANTTLVAVLERTGEIGVRRARRCPAPAHCRAVPRRINGAWHARRADRHLHRRRDRGDLRRRPELDRPAEPGLHLARPADRQRRRPARGRVSGAACGPDEPAGGTTARVNRGAPDAKGRLERNDDAHPYRLGSADLRRGSRRLHGQRAQGTCHDGDDTRRWQAGRPRLRCGGHVVGGVHALRRPGRRQQRRAGPGDTYDALHTACMNDAGYGQYAADVPYPVRTNRGLGFPQAYGPWGYVGTALAAQEGFLAPEAAGRAPEVAGCSATCPPGLRPPRASASTSWRTSTTPSSLTPCPSSRR
jgi:putative ABC transport system permease protein